jgi:transcriptional regulator with XRE-family HTH domain
MRLRKERKAVRPKLTQAKLGKVAGVPQGTISKLERGEILAPTYDTLDKLAKALRRYGRSVLPGDLQPRRQPALIKGFRAEPKQRRGAA